LFKTTMKSLKELTEAIAAKSKAIHDIFEEAGESYDMSKVKSLTGDTQAKLDAIKTMNGELDALHMEYEEVKALSDIRKNADAKAGIATLDVRDGKPGDQVKSKLNLGEQFVKSGALGQWNKDFHFDVDLKSIMQTASGWDPETVRLPGVVSYPLRSLRVADVFPTYPTIRDTITYMEETTHTNNAAEIAEETDASSPTAAGEAAIALTERSVPVEKIVVWIPVSEEQMADVAGLGAWLNGRLTYMVRNRLDGQLCAGDGSTPNIRGVLNASSIQTQAKGADPTPDAFFKAMTKVRGTTAGTGFGEPTAIIIHPNDWQDIRLLRTNDGIYIFGNPSDAGVDRLWGVPVVATAAETENTGVVGDFAQYAAFFNRSGVDIAISNSHGYLFTASTLAVRATIRGAAVYFRGSAFAKVTGI
jgi:hypothetical protein